MMHRNLDRRVEVLTQVTGPNTEHLRFTLDLAFAADTGAWQLQPDDKWIRGGGPHPVDYQGVMLSQLTSRSE
jgi:polyphosphate kinase